MCKLTVRKVICMFLVISCVILTGCSKSNSNVSQENFAKEVEQLKVEINQLKQNIEEMNEVHEYQTNLIQVKNLEGYSKEDLERLQDEFEKLMLDPRYEPKEDMVALFYYICGNTDVIKEIYDNGNATLAEAIIEQHMLWSGQFKFIKDFIKTWTRATTMEDSQWNEMIYNKCVKAFYTFKYYPEDLEIAQEKLPDNVFSEIASIHVERNVFPEGYSKEDFN